MSENKTEINLKKWWTYEAKIENLWFWWEWIAKIDDFVIFIKWWIPGQKVKFVLQKKKKTHWNWKIIEVLEKSDYEIEAKCKHFWKCWGCKWQNLSYEKQLEFKDNQVKESLKHIWHFDLENIKFSPIIWSPKKFWYRNKAEFSFWYEEMKVETNEKWEKTFHDTWENLWFHKPWKFQEIVNIENCHLITENANQVFKLVKEACLEFSKEVFNPYSHQWLWRHLLIRENLEWELMINLIVNLSEKKYHNQNFNDFLEKLSEKLKNFWWNFDFWSEACLSDSEFCSEKIKNSSKIFSWKVKNFFYTNNSWMNDDWSKFEIHKIFWDETINEKILWLNFKISPTSFFQTNSKWAENLYSVVKNFAEEIEFKSDKVFLDLYCGTWTIWQILAKDSNAQVIWIEYIPSAVEDAKKNSELNKLSNTEFICWKVEEELPTILEEFEKLDLIVIDPPRAWMHKKAIETIIESWAKNLIYVSCNPATFARDAEIFSEFYELEKVQPVDMFPHTSHIELVAKFRLK